MTKNRKLLDWVKEVEAMCQPNGVHWCDGSQAEYDEMIRLMVEGEEVHFQRFPSEKEKVPYISLLE